MFAAIILLVAITTTAAAQQGVGVKYSQDYRWHGFPVFGRDFIHSGIDTKIGGIEVGAATHTSQGNDLENWDTQVGITLPIGGDSIDAKTGFGYLILPGGTEIKEVSATVSIPGAITPSYTISHIEQGKAENGQIRTVAIDVGFGGEDPNAISANLKAACTYNDGVNPFGEKVIRSFTHATAGFRLNVPAGNIMWQPGVIWQHTFDKEVSDQRNGVWGVLDMQYRF
jgi:hypothetical protein